MSARGMSARPADWFELSGGALCLDLVNTVSNWPTEEPIERLETYSDLLEWSHKAGVLSASEARRRTDAARAHPRAAAAELAAVKRCREILRRLFSDVAAGRDTRGSLEAFTTEWRRLLPSSTLVPREDATRGRTRGLVRWSYDGPAGTTDALLWPILWSATELLSSDESHLVRECAARDCAWLFVDRSKGHRRRWCTMQICGNREKLRRFRHASD